MSKFDHAFDRSPSVTPAVTSLQTSLFSRLRRGYGRSAGTLGWLLVRLGQPDHGDYEAACEALRARPSTELLSLLGTVRAARAALAGKPDVDALAGVVAGELEAIATVALAAERACLGGAPAPRAALRAARYRCVDDGDPRFGMVREYVGTPPAEITDDGSPWELVTDGPTSGAFGTETGSGVVSSVDVPSGPRVHDGDES